MSDTIRRRDKDATRAALLDAAKTVLAEDGFQAFGVNAVARKAGCDKQLLYRYFGGLDGLLEAIGADVATWLGNTTPPPAMQTYADWIAHMADSYLTALRGNPLMQKIIIWELSAPPDKIAPLSQARGRAMMQWMAAARGSLEMPPGAGLFNAVMIAAIQQFVLSAASTGAFSGLPLRTDEDWDRVRGGLKAMAAKLYG